MSTFHFRLCSHLLEYKWQLKIPLFIGRLYNFIPLLTYCSGNIFACDSFITSWSWILVMRKNAWSIKGLLESFRHPFEGGFQMQKQCSRTWSDAEGRHFAWSHKLSCLLRGSALLAWRTHDCSISLLSSWLPIRLPIPSQRTWEFKQAKYHRNSRLKKIVYFTALVFTQLKISAILTDMP